MKQPSSLVTSQKQRLRMRRLLSWKNVAPTTDRRSIVFILHLAGQFFSLTGSGLTGFALGISTFNFSFSVAMTHTFSRAIWQRKVGPFVRGRVFAGRRMIAWSMLPFAYVIAGPLADKVFNPLLIAGGTLATTEGRVPGIGPGRGIGLLFVVLGIIVVLISALGFLSPRLRLVEEELPDTIGPTH